MGTASRDETRRYPLYALQHPLRAFLDATLIAIVAFLIGVVVPAYYAVRGAAFTESDLEKKVDSLVATKFSPEKQAQWKRYQREKQTFYNVKDCDSDRQSMKDKDRGKEQPKPPVVLVPFLSSPNLWVDLPSLTCLGMLIVLARPGRDVFGRGWAWWLSTAGLAVWLLVGKNWVQWVRNGWLSTTDHGRTVFAYPNYDIDPAAFWVQEAISFIWVFILAILWRQWIAHLAQQQAVLLKEAGDPVTRVFDKDRIRRLSNGYVHWQIASFLLSIPFLLNGFFYWPLVFRDNDQRYILSALLAQGLWATSWIFISLPLAVDWHSWSQDRSAAICKIRDDKLNALKELQPVSLVNLVSSGIGAVVSFFLPLVNTVLTTLHS